MKSGPRVIVTGYNRELLKVKDAILELLSEGLGLEKTTLKSHLRGAEPHTGMSAITILVPNDVLGLQVCKAGSWIVVDYLPGALFVDIGDHIVVLSNGKYNSVLQMIGQKNVLVVATAPPLSADEG